MEKVSKNKSMNKKPKVKPAPKAKPVKESKEAETQEPTVFVTCSRCNAALDQPCVSHKGIWYCKTCWDKATDIEDKPVLARDRGY